MATGWIEMNDTTYYLSAGAAMVTGYQTIDGTTHYFASNGSLIW